MATETLRVVARFVAKPDRVDELHALLKGLIEPTRKEKGCRSYELLQNKSQSVEFTFVEEWDNDAALETHLATTHLKSALARLPQLVSEAPDVRRYKVVA